MAALFLLWLFGSSNYNRPVDCGPLLPITMPLFKPEYQMTTEDEKGLEHIQISQNGVFYNIAIATITITDAGFTEIQVGVATDSENIEHNKKVEQCRVDNGQY